VILLDSSVWIAALRPGDVRIQDVVPFDDVVTCLPIIQEVLQGIRDENAWRRIRQAMLAMDIVESPLRLEVYDEAIGLFRSARRAGLTPRSSVDCLIAACALRNDLEVVHLDRDFPALARVSGLKQRSI
jgi:predicted nucleic acid-binding protein